MQSIVIQAIKSPVTWVLIIILVLSGVLYYKERQISSLERQLHVYQSDVQTLTEANRVSARTIEELKTNASNLHHEIDNLRSDQQTTVQHYIKLLSIAQDSCEDYLNAIRDADNEGGEDEDLSYNSTDNLLNRLNSLWP